MDSTLRSRCPGTPGACKPWGTTNDQGGPVGWMFTKNNWTHSRVQWDDRFEWVRLPTKNFPWSYHLSLAFKIFLGSFFDWFPKRRCYNGCAERKPVRMIPLISQMTCGGRELPTRIRGIGSINVLQCLFSKVVTWKGELHAFSDTWEVGYGAVWIFLPTARVAPLNSVWTPTPGVICSSFAVKMVENLGCFKCMDLTVTMRRI